MNKISEISFTYLSNKNNNINILSGNNVFNYATTNAFVPNVFKLNRKFYGVPKSNNCI